MSSITLLKEQIEEVRQRLDESALEGINGETFYELSIQMDKLIEEYRELENK